MQSVNRVIKFLWILSLLIFVSGIFYGYYILPDAVCIKFDSLGSPLEYWPRKYVFNFFVGVCATFNVLLILIERFVILLPARVKPVPNKKYWLQTEETRQALNFALSDWFYSFAATLNACLLIGYYILTKVNSDFHSNIIQYNGLFIFIGILIILWVIYLPVRLFISKIFIK